ncbi:hypothetical protein PIB30_046582 [Stylosanthes scabra]|uniref:Uncharacterized protein n=1 Tax=Stylosanthes scabra TaxID=79078 RepID=A0ABU6YI86_9FABA|nr:hypothetical protein [Stylosanthes scabra]
MAMNILDHFQKEDASDTNLREMAPSTDGGNARNPTRRKTKGNNPIGCKKNERCRICRYVQYNRTIPMVDPNLTEDLDGTPEITLLADSESETGFHFYNSECGRTNVQRHLVSMELTSKWRRIDNNFKGGSSVVLLSQGWNSLLGLSSKKNSTPKKDKVGSRDVGRRPPAATVSRDVSFCPTWKQKPHRHLLLPMVRCCRKPSFGPLDPS